MDPRVTELHCIMPIGNVPSVMQHDILSHERAAKLERHSVAMPEIQERRDQKHRTAALSKAMASGRFCKARSMPSSNSRSRALRHWRERLSRLFHFLSHFLFPAPGR